MPLASSRTWSASRSRRRQGCGLGRACCASAARRCPDSALRLLLSCCARRPRSASPSCPPTTAAGPAGQGAWTQGGGRTGQLGHCVAYVYCVPLATGTLRGGLPLREPHVSYLISPNNMFLMHRRKPVKHCLHCGKIQVQLPLAFSQTPSHTLLTLCYFKAGASRPRHWCWWRRATAG